MNIPLMFSTFAVLKLLPKISSVKLLHPLNIPLMLPTFAVLKPLKSSLVKLLHPLNIPSMYVTSDVFRFSILLTDDKFLAPLNHAQRDFGFTSLKESSNTTLFTLEL